MIFGTVYQRSHRIELIGLVWCKFECVYIFVCVSVYKNEPIDFDFSNIKYMNDVLSDKKIFNKTCNMIKYYYEQHIENTRLQRTTNKL